MTENGVRLSGPTLKVLRFLMDDIGKARSGAEMSKATKVGPGTLYPLLARLESHGWLSSEWEDVDPSEVGRPRRRYYRLTGVGQKSARAAFDELQIGGAFAWT